jgi:hypothetical protein
VLSDIVRGWGRGPARAVEAPGGAPVARNWKFVFGAVVSADDGRALPRRKVVARDGDLGTVAVGRYTRRVGAGAVSRLRMRAELLTLVWNAMASEIGSCRGSGGLLHVKHDTVTPGVVIFLCTAHQHA